MDTKFKFEQVKKQLVAMQRETLVLLSNQAQNYFVKSFKNQGFNGEPWKEVQRRTPDTKAYKYPKKKGLQRRTSPILIGAGFKKRGGTLRLAVSNMARTAQIGNGTVRMIVDLPYAAIQNDGGVISAKARTGIINLSNKKRGFVSAKKATHQQKVNIGAHTINIKKRTFVGQTQELTNMQVKKIEQIVTKIFHV